MYRNNRGLTGFWVVPYGSMNYIYHILCITQASKGSPIYSYRQFGLSGVQGLGFIRFGPGAMAAFRVFTATVHESDAQARKNRSGRGVCD